MDAHTSDGAPAGSPPSRRGIRIGGRLLLLLAVPLVGLLSLTGLGVYSGYRDMRAATELQDRTQAALDLFGLADELQLQRSSLVESGGVNPESLSRAADLRARVAADRTFMDAAERRQLQTTLAWVDGAQKVAGLGLSDNAALSSLSPAVDSVLGLASVMIDPNGAVDASPASTTENLARAQAAAHEEYDRLRVTSRQRKLDPTDFQTLIALASAQRSYLGLAATTATGDMPVRIERVSHGIAGADLVRQATFRTGADADFTEWQNGIRSRGDELASLNAEAQQVAVAVVDQLEHRSFELLVIAAAAALITLIVTVFLLRRALRSIARPLEHLAARADEIAKVDLPAAVKAQQDDPDATRSLPRLKVKGAPEVAEVAAAFNDVQDTALRLAGEQAALRVNQEKALTNLGRRNQTLLARQLNYLSSLEREETDPVFLEHLFKLDHLASRMRRNAESLLILAGTETPRIRRRPAKVTEIVRAAMSEVEDFERVRIGNLRDDTLVGPVVIDVIHLLAELIENALSFSPPHSEVVIEGGPLAQGGYQMAIIDQGVGMAEIELIEANKRLAGTDELDGMPTRYLGQYVVAKLAAKTGALVKLQPAVGGRGTSALVSLPAGAMVESANRAAVSGPRPGSRASRSAGPVPFAPGSAVEVTTSSAPEPAPQVPDLRDSQRAAALTAEATVTPATVERAPDRQPPSYPTVDTSEPAAADQVVPPVVVESGDEVPRAEVDRVFGADRSVPERREVPPGEWWNEPLKNPTPPPPSPVPATPVEDTAVPTAAAEPAAAEPVAAAAPVPTELPELPRRTRAAVPTPGSPSGAGSLKRRVPGASLAAREPGPADGAAPVPERSAEQVRSRLASFQAGRSRGRGDSAAQPAESGAATAVLPFAEPTSAALDDSNSHSDDSHRSQDWRSTP